MNQATEPMHPTPFIIIGMLMGFLISSYLYWLEGQIKKAHYRYRSKVVVMLATVFGGAIGLFVALFVDAISNQCSYKNTEPIYFIPIISMGSLIGFIISSYVYWLEHRVEKTYYHFYSKLFILLYTIFGGSVAGILCWIVNIVRAQC